MWARWTDADTAAGQPVLLDAMRLTSHDCHASVADLSHSTKGEMGMASKRGILWLAVLLVMSGIALAQRAYVGIEQRLSAEQVREIGLTPAQVALLDRYLREVEASAPPVETARYEAAEGASKPDPTRFAGLDVERIASKAKGTISGWEPGTVFELENGQQWKVLKGSMKLRKPLQDPEIVLVPGIAGRWFLQVDEDMPKARVYRID
jgi:hypothetical protein